MKRRLRPLFTSLEQRITPANTPPTLVRDIEPGLGGSFPDNTLVIGTNLYFAAEQAVSGNELWASDGTSLGTRLVLDINPGTGASNPDELTDVGGGRFFFSATNGSSGRELWISDGTAAGTSLVLDIQLSGGSYPSGLTNVNGKVFFYAGKLGLGRELWTSDGTAAGTVMVADLAAGGASSVVGDVGVNVGGIFYFPAMDIPGGGPINDGLELWRSDGTLAGTFIVSDINPGSAGSSPEMLTEFNGQVVFAANDGTSGREPWISNGTSTGTVLLNDINSILSDSSDPSSFTNFSGTLVFQASDGVIGSELWKSDGTSSGTFLVRDINPGSGGSFPSEIAEVGGQLYFGASDGFSGTELWRSDGNSLGTLQVADINTGIFSSYPSQITDVAGVAYFVANGGTGYELWRSDGSKTTLIDIDPNTLAFPAALAAMGDRLFFAASRPDVSGELFSLFEDNIPPRITEIDSPDPDGSYFTGQFLTITITFSEPITLAGGPLMVTLDSGATIFFSPGTSQVATAIYAIAPDQQSPDLNVTAIALAAGATLTDAAGNPANLSLPALNLAVTSNLMINPAPLTFVVTNNADSGVGSFRQAVLNSNSNGGKDTITFDPTFFSTPRTIIFGSETTITDSVTIIGPGASQVTFDGNKSTRPLGINGPGVLTVNISGITVSNGQIAGDGGAVVIADENVTLDGVVVSKNIGSGSGGGIFVGANGRLTVNNSTIRDNITSTDGAGIAADKNARVVIFNSTVSGNTSNDDGAGVSFSDGGSFLLDRSTISGNLAFGFIDGLGGGGIYFYGAVNSEDFIVSNSTISGNTHKVSNGGGIAFLNLTTVAGSSDAIIRNSTIVANSTLNFGGGISSVETTGSFDEIQLVSSVLSGNLVSGSSNGTDLFNSGIGTVTGSFSAVGVDPLFGYTDGGNNLPFQPFANLLLGPLQFNSGGTTLTHAITKFASPLVSAGSNPAGLTVDQNGSPRVIGAAVDIGSAEFNPAPAITSINSPQPDGSYFTGQTITVTINFSEPVTLSGGPLQVLLDSGATLTISPFTPFVSSVSANYTIAAGQFSPDLNVTNLVLANGATLRNASGVDANLTLPMSNLAVNRNLMVNLPNGAPSISPIADQAVTAGNTVGPIAFTVNDLEFGPDPLTLSVISNNPVLIPVSAVTFGGTGANRSITINTMAGVSGITRLTVIVSDPSGASSSQEIDIVQNGPPVISDIPNQMVTAGATVGPIPFTIGGNQTPHDMLVLSASSDNAAIPPSAITFGGSGINRTVTVTTPAGVAAVTTITVTVTDPTNGLTDSDTFTITQSLANTPPTISDISNLLVAQGKSVGPINFTIGDLETPANKLTVTAVSSDPILFPASAITLGGTNANRTITVAAPAGSTGSAIISVTVTDGQGLTATDTFTVAISTGTVLGPTKEFSVGSGPNEGSALTFFNPDGSERVSIFPFGADYTCGIRTATSDFNGDGVSDIVAGIGNMHVGRVMAFDGATQAVLFDFQPFGPNFMHGVYTSAGDITGDGRAELAITADRGGGARVRVFSPTATGFVQIADFFGLQDANGNPDRAFHGGARSAIGDLNNDGFGELFFAIGEGGGPRIAIFNGKTLGLNGGPKLRGDFMVFEPNLKNGTYISVGDIDADGVIDLAATPALRGGPRVSVFSGAALLNNQLVRIADFFVWGTDARGGLRVAVKNLDNDANLDILVGAGPGDSNRVAGFSGKDLVTPGPDTAIFDYEVYEGVAAGVFVG